MVRDGRWTSSFQVWSDALGMQPARDLRVAGSLNSGLVSRKQDASGTCFQGPQACSALSGLSQPALLKPHEEYAVVITTLPMWTLRLREVESLHQVAQLVNGSWDLSSGSAESELSSPLCSHLLGRGPKPALLHSEIWPTEKEGASSSSLFNHSPPNSVGIISQMFLRSASSLVPSPGALAGTQGPPPGPCVQHPGSSLSWAPCPERFRAWPHPCLAPLLPLTFPAGRRFLHVASRPLRSSPRVISMHLFSELWVGPSSSALDSTVSCLELLSHYSDVGSGSPRLSSFIFM